MQITNPVRSEAVRDKEGATIEVRYYGTDVIGEPGTDEFSFRGRANPVRVQKRAHRGFVWVKTRG